MTDRVVIIGAGQAASQAIASLRTDGFLGPIAMIGDEPYLPYQRPPLSKKFLAGELEYERLFIKPAEFYPSAGVEMHLRRTATAIDTRAKSVRLDDGTLLDYGKLVIATGSRVRKLTIEGSGLDGLYYLRSIDDVRAIQARFKPGAKLVIVGAGYIGLEVAAVAVKRGFDVTVLEVAPRVMARVTSKPISDFYERVHREAGVKIRFGLGVTGFAGENNTVREVIAGSERFPADLVVIGVGVLPNAEIAGDAGIACDNGIVVDAYGRTSDPDVYAAGDCTNHPNALLGCRLRLESVQNAIEQAKAVAAAIAGKPKPYAEVPWFWSDQYDLKLQIAGISRPTDELVVRGNPANRKFAVFYLRDGAVAAVDAVNAAPEFMMGKVLIAKKTKVPQARLADLAVSMKEIAA